MKRSNPTAPRQKYFKGHVRLLTNLFPATFQIFGFFCTLQIIIIIPFKTFQTISALFVFNKAQQYQYGQLDGDVIYGSENSLIGHIDMLN